MPAGIDGIHGHLTATGPRRFVHENRPNVNQGEEMSVGRPP